MLKNNDFRRFRFLTWPSLIARHSNVVMLIIRIATSKYKKTNVEMDLSSLFLFSIHTWVFGRANKGEQAPLRSQALINSCQDASCSISSSLLLSSFIPSLVPSFLPLFFHSVGTFLSSFFHSFLPSFQLA